MTTMKLVSRPTKTKVAAATLPKSASITIQERVARGLYAEGPFVSTRDLKQFAKSRVKHRLEDLKPVQRS